MCKLPKAPGRCKAYIPSWYYDYKDGKCKTFIYGGCGGNANRFKTKARCQTKCGEKGTHALSCTEATFDFLSNSSIKE